MIEYQELLMTAIDSLDLEMLDKIVLEICGAIQYDQRIFFIGNGGNSTTASHIACDLQKGLSEELSVKALSLCDNIALLTAWSNDKDFKFVYSEQIYQLSQPSDMLIALSGSGNSPNILEAVDAAKKLRVTTIGISGFDGGKLAKEVHHPLVIDSDDMQIVEDVTLTIGHIIYREVLHRAGRGELKHNT
ncbi:MAG: SIS domain-containing protein [Candidatus Izemoplasmatales bacterium]|jgi:D-sedoheptulose 7-phosphate isomerase